MMLAPTVKKIIDKYSDFLEIDSDYVFTYSVDPNVRSSEIAENTLLITEVSDSINGYGSGQSITRAGRVQVQIFFSPTYEGDTSLLRDKLETIMRENGWYLQTDSAIGRDPDTDSLFCSMSFENYYNKNLIL